MLPPYRMKNGDLLLLQLQMVLLPLVLLLGICSLRAD